MAKKKATPQAERVETAAGDRALSDKCRRWKRELALAGTREKAWRAAGDKIYKRYRAEDSHGKRYNVLWSNTDVMLPAIFNSKPEPDVRRRFRDSDPLGRAVGEVLERSLAVVCDGDMTVDTIKADVLDGLLPGRGISRVRYVAKLTPQEAKEQAKPDNDAKQTAEDDSATEASAPVGDLQLEKVDDEQVIFEHVEWKDYRQGFGRTWVEVPWQAFRHQMSRKDAEEKFGKEALAGVKYEVCGEGDTTLQGKNNEQATAKLAEFWEIWDKDGDEVFFLCDQLEVCLYPLVNLEGEPPLKLDGFFCTPKPLQLIDDNGTMVPIPLFRMYEDQADQVDRLTVRIDKITEQMRLRGIYDAAFVELKGLLSSDDNELTPIENAKAYMANGGLEKAIAWYPVEQAIEILKALYEARELQLKVIDQLLGISDIVRGATDPDETLGAQQMKGGYFSIRLWRYQAEVKRYGRDLLRLAAQVMAQRFGPDTFSRMTDLNFPTPAQKLELQRQIQQAQQPPQPGAPPPPPPPNPALLKVPTWEDIIKMMRSPSLRQFRTDVETDSMIAGTLQSDMSSMAVMMEGLVKLFEGLAPMVEAGALPMDSAKELILAVIRRAKLGSAVEDAFDKMVQPKPKPDPKAAAAQADAANDARKIELQAQTDDKQMQMQAQSDERIEQIRAANKEALQQMQSNAENQRVQFREEQATQRAQLLETLKTQREEDQIRFDGMIKLIVAAISATKQPDAAVQSTADSAVTGDSPKAIEAPEEPKGPTEIQQLHGTMQQVLQHLARPKKIVRDANNRIAGIE